MTEAVDTAGVQSEIKGLSETVTPNRHLSAQQIKQAVIDEVWHYISQQNV